MPRRVGAGSYSEVFSGGDITADEWEFIRAVAAYQRRWRRRYPTWREVLHVARCLGYRKVAVPIDPSELLTAAEKRLIEAADRERKAEIRSPEPASQPDPGAPGVDTPG